MKRCPTCQKTFDDSLRFCQFDGTPLNDDLGTDAGLPSDPLKTIVGAAPIRDDENEILQIGDNIDPTKNLISNADLQPAQPPLDESKNNARSPFDNFSSASSPFDSPDYRSPSSPFQEPQIGRTEKPFNQNQFDNAQNNQYGQPLQQAAWTPPPAPETGWQSRNIGANTPFQPPVYGQGHNQTLPIVSLVLGIVSAVCCWFGFLTGPAALVTGYLGRKNARENPQEFCGDGMALAGMITGGIGTLISIGYFLLVIIGAIGGSLR